MRVWAVTAGAVLCVLVVLFGYLGATGRGDADAQAGDCARLTRNHRQVRLVECTDPRAEYVVLKRTGNGDGRRCTDEPRTVRTHRVRTGRRWHQHGHVLCLGRRKG
ncbi:LppU/SCO3897 family protein [Kitasatospora camelliae]|uniref:Secreted protein n=1 Tax=Kitasatospora camelliae TaxID=3156397 RepID=A0AAU8JW80_9ACTN